MDEDFNTPDEFGPPAPAEEYGPPRVPNPAEPLDPFNANDAIRLDRLNQDWSQVEVESSTGDLSPFHADKLFGAMKGERERLLQKQQATKQRQQAEQQQSVMGANAFGQAVQQANAEHAAANFGKTVPSFTDPVTGKTTHFRPKGWEPIDTDEASGLGEGEPVAGATTDQASGLAESPEQAAPQLRSNSDGTHTVTIYNGENRADTHFHSDASSPTGMRAFGRDEYDRNGQLVRPQTQAPTDTIRRKAENELGRPEPRKWVPGPGGRPAISPEWSHWDTGVRQIDNRMRQQDAERERHANAQVETAFKDSLANHPLKNYQDSANPNVARMDAIMDDFAKMHPNDKRVQDWRAQRSSLMGALAKKEPSAMTLGELATAANGAHVNVQQMIEKAEKDIKADARVMPEGTTGRSTGITYNPQGGNGKGPWQHMDPEDIHAEAVAHVRSRLTQQLADQRKAVGQAPAATPDQPQTAQPQQSATPAAVPSSVAQRINNRNKELGLGAEAKKHADRDEQPSILHRVFNPSEDAKYTGSRPSVK